MSRCRQDRGSTAVETAVIAPALVFLLLLVVYAGRTSQAQGDVRRASSEAARAASLVDDAAAASDAARSVAQEALAESGVACGSLTTVVDTSNLEPGGSVTVTVTCNTSLSDVTLIGVPGERTFTARSVEIVDRYRADG
jgi:Flp pilus assembly protein TadG